MTKSREKDRSRARRKRTTNPRRAVRAIIMGMRALGRWAWWRTDKDKRQAQALGMVKRLYGEPAS